MYKLPKPLIKITTKHSFVRKNFNNNKFNNPKIVYSKKVWQKRTIPNISKFFVKTTTPAITLSYNFNMSINKVIKLNYNSLNYWFYSNFKSKSLFKYLIYTNFNHVKFKKSFYYSGTGFFTKINYFINNIEAKPNMSVTYAKAWNSKAKILNINFKFLSLLILLPSKKYKVLSLFVRFSYADNNLSIFNKLYDNNSYKKSKLMSKAPSVRGIAMNPVDHPHGGRTKTIRSPKTPWGYTAKNNK